jgi:hypothetical protein
MPNIFRHGSSGSVLQLADVQLYRHKFQDVYSLIILSGIVLFGFICFGFRAVRPEIYYEEIQIQV